MIVSFWLKLYEDFQSAGGNIEESAKSSTSLYKDEVIEILNKNRANNICDDNLRAIQTQIENLTMRFDEESIYKTNPYLIKMLASNEQSCINAKDFLINKLKSDEDKRMIALFGHYTLEALIVYVLSQLYNSNSNTMVRVASLVDQLERNVRSHGLLITRRGIKTKTQIDEKESKTQIDEKESKTQKIDKMFPIGAILVDFMLKKEIISVSSDKSTSVIGKKKDTYYLESTLYVVCNFYLSLLPIKFNLPMVCKPLDWERARRGDDPPRFLSDLKGGYLTTHCGNLSRYNLISSNNINHYYINIEGNHEKICSIMNKLQGQAFQINEDMLGEITENYSKFVESGLLMPRFLSNIKMKDITPLLRENYMKDAEIRKLKSFDNLLHQLQKDIQRARYENLIINMANAYTGYKFYLPVFLDFRGRIYRCGLLHFHEGDLARSLIMFANYNGLELKRLNVANGGAFHFKSFKSYEESYDWLKKECVNGFKKDIYKFSAKAKNPFQFISSIRPLFSRENDLEFLGNLPITKDASASAYQIMSYFLLDETMAYRTNLFSLSTEKNQIKLMIFIHIFWRS